MKTGKLLAPFLLLLFTSCVHDFISKDSSEIVITETNYILSEDIKTIHLENKNLELSAEIKDLQLIIDAGKADEQTEARFAIVSAEFAANNKIIDNILNQRDMLLKIVPPPPCPKPRNCNDWFGINNLISPKDNISFSSVIYDANQNVLAETIGTPKPLNQFDGIVNVITLEWKNKDYKGDILVKVSTVDKNNIPDEYFASFNIK